MTEKKRRGAQAPGVAKQQFWGGRMAEPPEMRNVAYCAGRDVAARPMADALLVTHDIWQNRAHSLMLAKRGIMPQASLRKVLKGLADFERRAAAGGAMLDPRKEDVHTNIEHFVAATAGAEHAGHMHTGRSRNDQSATVVRMLVREELLGFGEALAGLVDAMLAASARFAGVVIPGFTHYQPASLTTLGHWFAGHAQALLRDVGRLAAAWDRVNVSPLGAAASFGTSWPIDREMTARLLGFGSVQANTLDCITSRWEMEAEAAGVLAFAMTHLSIVAQDLIVLSMPDVGVVEIADRYVTGSSIMPQKRNPDFAEVTRAKAAVIQNLVATLFGIAKGALSGYNRDTQWTKYLVIDALSEAADAPAVFTGVFETLRVNEARAAELSRRGFVDAVDVADALARESGLPFRQSYEIVSKAVKLSEGLGSVDSGVVARLAAEAGAKNTRLTVGSPKSIVAAKSHTGAPAPRALARDRKQMSAVLREMRAELAARRRLLDAARAETRRLASKCR
jgi:argininosuccinate lyase